MEWTQTQWRANAQRLPGFLTPLVADLGRSERRAGATRYVEGLLLPGQRKSIEPMAERLGVDSQKEDGTWPPHPCPSPPPGGGEGNDIYEAVNPGWRSCLADPDTLSKVIHSRAERASKAERSENHFGAMNFESNLRPGDNGFGRKARGRTRLANPNPTRIEPGTPVDPGAFIKKSERTTPQEGHRIGTTHDQAKGRAPGKLEAVFGAGFDFRSLGRGAVLERACGG